MSGSFRYPTKAFLAQTLSVAEIKTGIITHQPVDTVWAQSSRTKAQLTTKATLHTLGLTMLDKLHEPESHFSDKGLHIAQLTQFLANRQKNAPHIVAQPSKQISEKLQKHINVLKTAGLLTKEEEDRIDSFLTLCKHERETIDNKEGVVDIITRELIEDEDDIVRLSDGHCYSKNSIITFIQSGTVDTDTGLPYLPIVKKPITKTDYEILGITEPTKEKIEAAIESQEFEDLLQMRLGDIEAWRAGNGPAREEFALFITDLVERSKLAKAFNVATTELLKLRRPLPITPTTQVAIDQRIPLTIKKQIISAGDDYDRVPVSAIMQDGNVYRREAEYYYINNTKERTPRKFEASINQPPSQNVSFCSVEKETILQNDGKLFSDGGYFNCIGDRKIVSVSIYFSDSVALLENGKVCIDIDEDEYHIYYGDYLVSGRSKYVAAGQGFIIGIFENGSIWAIGDDEKLELPPSINNSKYITVDGGEGFAVAIKEDGTVKVWTKYDDDRVSEVHGQRLANGHKFISVAAGRDFIVGLLDDNSVVVWGEDDYGQVSQAQQAINGRKIVEISAGLGHVVALTESRELVVWGASIDKQYDYLYETDIKLEQVRCMLPTELSC